MKRKRGRPRLASDDESVPVHLTLPSREYDLAYALARRDRISVPEVLRRAFRRAQKKNSK
jgi:hypothetical protein